MHLYNLDSPGLLTRVRTWKRREKEMRGEYIVGDSSSPPALLARKGSWHTALIGPLPSPEIIDALLSKIAEYVSGFVGFSRVYTCSGFTWSRGVAIGRSKILTFNFVCSFWQLFFDLRTYDCSLPLDFTNLIIFVKIEQNIVIESKISVNISQIEINIAKDME